MNLILFATLPYLLMFFPLFIPLCAIPVLIYRDVIKMLNEFHVWACESGEVIDYQSFKNQAREIFQYRESNGYLH